MKRILLFCAGAGLAVAAVPLLWLGPDRYQYEEFWFELHSSRFMALGLMALGAGAAAGAAFGLGYSLQPPSDQTGRRWARPGVIGAVLFLLAAMGPFGSAQRGWENVEVFATLPPGQVSPQLVRAVLGNAYLALAFGSLYVATAVASVVAPRYWPMDWRINWTGIAIVCAGLLQCALGILAWVGNALTMEAARAEVSVMCNLVILGGVLTAAAGAILAVVGHRASDGMDAV